MYHWKKLMVGYCEECNRRRENCFLTREKSDIRRTFLVTKKFDSSYVINVILWSWHSFITKSTYFLIMYPKYNLISYTSEWGNSSATIVTKLGTERRRIRDQITTMKKEILLFSKNLVQVPRPIKPPIQRAPLCRLLGLRVRIPSEAWVCLFWMLWGVRYRCLRRPDNPSRGVLPSVVCLSDWGNPQRMSSREKKIYRRMNLNFHFHIVRNLRMCVAIPPLPHTSPWCTQGQICISFVILISSSFLFSSRINYSVHRSQLWNQWHSQSTKELVIGQWQSYHKRRKSH